MRVLYVAEIVGKPGLHCVKSALRNLRQERSIDFVIANGDSVTGGFGLGKNHSVYLKKLGVDVITGGDQIYFKKDMADHIEKSPYILRPSNLSAEAPGRGWRHFNVTRRTEPQPAREPAESGADETASPGGEQAADRSGAGTPDAPKGNGATNDAAQAATAAGATAAGGAAAGTKGAAAGAKDEAAAKKTVELPKHSISTMPPIRIGLVCLMGQSGFGRMHGNNPFTYLSNVIERIHKQAKIVLVDFHAMTTAEKYTMFHHADGMVTAVIGSGQRVMTADAQVLSGGTAVICDAGRTGSQLSVGGYLPEPEVQKYLTQRSHKSEMTWKQLELQGVLLEIDEANGWVYSIEPVRVPCTAPEGAGSSGSGDNDDEDDGDGNTGRS